MRTSSRYSSSSLLSGPFLDTVKARFSSSYDTSHYPFCIPIVKNLQELSFPTQVTFFVGENGTGKSTLLEAIAYHAGFGAEGGSKNIAFSTSADTVHSAARALSEQLVLSWRQKPKDGYFFRAESFYNVATYLDYLERECGGRAYAPYGGASLHSQSHGESFLSFFKYRVSRGFFILDEPEAALSPQRQLALLVIMSQLCKKDPSTQFIIATHSPLLLAFPGATLYCCDGDKLETIAYTETDHYQITKRFLDDPDRYVKSLFAEE